jgi:hypothetical protein
VSLCRLRRILRSHKRRQRGSGRPRTSRGRIAGVPRPAPVGLRLKAALPIAADLYSHGNVSPRHLTAFGPRLTWCSCPPSRHVLSNTYVHPARQRMTALQKHEQVVRKSCNLRSARNLSACLAWSTCADRRASGQSLTLAKLDEPGGRTLPVSCFIYFVSIL